MPPGLPAYHPDRDWLESVTLLVIRPLPPPPSSSASSDDQDHELPSELSSNKANYKYKYDYQLCTIERSKAEFVAGDVKQRALPAIILHVADFDPKWRSILGPHLVAYYEARHNERNNLQQSKNEEWAPILNEQANRTAQDARAISGGGEILVPELALRIAAIRCLYSEIGK